MAGGSGTRGAGRATTDGTAKDAARGVAVKDAAARGMAVKDAAEKGTAVNMGVNMAAHDRAKATAAVTRGSVTDECRTMRVSPASPGSA